MWKTIARGRARLFEGDCMDALEEMPSNSVDSVLTDPPYVIDSVRERFGKPGSAPAKFGKDGLFQRSSAPFVGAEWDTGEVVFSPEFWREVRRVLKPGGYVLAMGGDLTYHKLATAIETAMPIRGMLGWLYGTGTPKTHPQGDDRQTALKPAIEPIACARKNVEGTIAANIEKWGTGCFFLKGQRIPGVGSDPEVGGYPSNITHDGSPEVLAALGDKARFFYCAKPTTLDRMEGTELLTPPEGVDRTNWHPTVKPTPLLGHFARLTTPPGGVIFDPFMGSGSTGKAAMLNGFDFIGCEMDPSYMPIAAARVNFGAGIDY